MAESADTIIEHPTLTPVGRQAGEAEIVLTQVCTIVGSSPQAELRLDGKSVSRFHCLIVRCGRDVTVRDLASRNGTYVNKNKISERALHSSDIVHVGDRPFQFRRRGSRTLPQSKRPPVARLAGEDWAGVEISSTTFLIGRREGCDVLLENDEVAPAHAAIVAIDGGHQIIDLHTPGGTRVNGAAIKGAKTLSPSDKIEIAGNVMRYETKSAPLKKKRMQAALEDSDALIPLEVDDEEEMPPVAVAEEPIETKEEEEGAISLADIRDLENQLPPVDEESEPLPPLHEEAENNPMIDEPATELPVEETFALADDAMESPAQALVADAALDAILPMDLPEIVAEAAAVADKEESTIVALDGAVGPTDDTPGLPREISQPAAAGHREDKIQQPVAAGTIESVRPVVLEFGLGDDVVVPSSNIQATFPPETGMEPLTEAPPETVTAFSQVATSAASEESAVEIDLNDFNALIDSLGDEVEGVAIIPSAAVVPVSPAIHEMPPGEVVRALRADVEEDSPLEMAAPEQFAPEPKPILTEKVVATFASTASASPAPASIKPVSTAPRGRKRLAMLLILIGLLVVLWSQRRHHSAGELTIPTADDQAEHASMRQIP